ncbi:MAG: hypothetical protein PHD74_04215 [Candidatus Krumholzibacteria bacterium]|nr:hypothetical protein [Candidatus Krumholzibacteria bacterium]
MIARIRSRGALWALLGGLAFLVDTSCEKLVPVPETDYRKTDAGKKETYRLMTKDDRVYEFKRFAVTDSTLIILEVKSYGDPPSPYETSMIKAPVLVPWKDVKTLERCEPHTVMTTIAIIGGVCLAGAILARILVAAALSEALGGMN